MGGQDTLNLYSEAIGKMTENTHLPALFRDIFKNAYLPYRDPQGESVNILLNFTQFFETRIEYRFQIFTAHSCDFLLPSYARLA